MGAATDDDAGHGVTEEDYGPYRVGARLGRGGMGEVHEAWDTTRERAVALKRLHTTGQDDPDVKERFRRESRIAARLDSPHVVPIHDFGIIDGRMYIDMRLVRGSDLGNLIRAQGPLAPTRAAAIIEQVADALDAAHRAGIVHRDVKPTNILRVDTSTGRDFVYLADFGIAHVRDASDASRLTATGAFIGTPAYMAPEQLRGNTIDPRTDVYALGAVLFEALTGRPPFLGDPATVITAHLTTTPPRPSSLANIPSGLDDVILTALSKEPSGRYPTTSGLAAAAARSASRPSPPRVEQRAITTDIPRLGGEVRPPRAPSEAPSAPPSIEGSSGAPDIRHLFEINVPPRVPQGRRKDRTHRAAVSLTAAVMALFVSYVVFAALSTQPRSDPAIPAAPASAPSPTTSSVFVAVTAEQLESEVAVETGAQNVSCPEKLPTSLGARVSCTGYLEGRNSTIGLVFGAGSLPSGFEIVSTS